MYISKKFLNLSASNKPPDTPTTHMLGLQFSGNVVRVCNFLSSADRNDVLQRLTTKGYGPRFTKKASSGAMCGGKYVVQQRFMYNACLEAFIDVDTKTTNTLRRLGICIDNAYEVWFERSATDKESINIRLSCEIYCICWFYRSTINDANGISDFTTNVLCQP